MEIRRLSPSAAAAARPMLIALLQDVVDTGASVGFLPPLAAAEADDYWQGVIGKIAAPDHILFGAYSDEQLIGTVQLSFESRPNGNHRAEVSKLLVHTQARRRGIATALMEHLEQAARERDRSLLVLDTLAGDVAEQLYLRLGFQQAGMIPNYARSGDGKLYATMYMYKLLDA